MSSPAFISEADVEALRIEPRLVREALIDILAEAAVGDATGAPKVQIDASTGTYFQALTGVSARLGMAAVKWAAIAPPRPGNLSVTGIMILSDVLTGTPIAVIDATWITRARTGAMTAVAAAALAPSESRNVGFIGAGAQARSQLDAIAEVFPRLSTITAYDRYESSAQRFIVSAQQRGLEGRVVADPADAVRSMDIVVSTVPSVGMDAPFLDAAWLAPDSFVSMVDLGRSWKPDSFHHFAAVATDDIEQSTGLVEHGKIKYAGAFHHSLIDCSMGRVPHTAHGRKAFVFAGIGLADLAAAAVVFRAFSRKGEKAA